jgi:CAAX protease family protein
MTGPYSSPPGDAKRDDRRPVSVFAGAGWTVAVSALLMVAVSATEAARPGATADWVNLAGCHLLAHLLVIFAMIRLYDPHGSVRSVLALRPTNPLLVLLAGASGAGLFPMATKLDEWIQTRYPPAQEDPERLAHLFDTSTRSARLTIFVAVVLVIPIAEELFFRGVLFGGMRRARDAAGTVLVTAAFFALRQGEPRAVPTSLALGLLLGWMRAASGSVLASAAAHVAFFAVGIVPMVLGHDEQEFSWRFAGAALAGGLLAALLAEWVTRHDRWAEAARGAD